MFTPNSATSLFKVCYKIFTAPQEVKVHSKFIKLNENSNREQLPDHLKPKTTERKEK